ncbi:MAG: hypothetical protein HOV87_30465 [Catenulispora sp.]|nr:hypothetical protein [Catenulispora sp.]
MWSKALRVGITGHLDLTAATCASVTAEIRDHLIRLGGSDLVGVTCLARGADTLFAEQVIAMGGRLVVIIPSPDYFDQEVSPAEAPLYRSLVETAWAVRRMATPHAGDEAYRVANREMLESVDRLLAVWDGNPNGGAGGTAAVVREARRRDLPVTVIWPEGARRLRSEH